MANGNNQHVDISEFMRIIRLLDERNLERGLKTGVGKAMTVVTKETKKAAKAALAEAGHGTKGGSQKSRTLHGVTVWRRPLYMEFFQFTWKKGGLGATQGIGQKKGDRQSRAYILRWLEKGTAARYTRYYRGKPSVRYRGQVYKNEAEGGKGKGLYFYAAAVYRSMSEAQRELAYYTVQGIRRQAGR